MADPQVHPNEMAVNAARKAVERARIDPMDIDVVLSTTEEWREYLLWTTALDIANELGAKNAWGLDIHARCVTTIAALKLARGLMADDPNINTVLIAGGYDYVTGPIYSDTAEIWDPTTGTFSTPKVSVRNQVLSRKRPTGSA